MAFRGVLRTAFYAVLLYSMIWMLPAYSKQYCSVAEHAEQAPCQAYFELETRATQVHHRIETHIEPYVKRVSGHPWTLKAVKAYSNTPIPALLTRAQVWVETEGKPCAAATAARAATVGQELAKQAYVAGDKWAKCAGAQSHKWAKQSYATSRDLATRGYAASCKWTREHALPFLRKQAYYLKVHAVRLAKLTWARISNSHFYNKWVLTQYHKIVTGPKPHLSQHTGSSKVYGSYTAGSETPEPTPSAAEQSMQEPAYATPDHAVGEAEPEEAGSAPSTPSETAEVSEVQPPTATHDAETKSEPPATEPSRISRSVSTPDDEEPAAPGPLAGEEAEFNSDTPELMAAQPAAPEPVKLEADTNKDTALPSQHSTKKSWLSRLSRTVEGAIASMEDDGTTLAQRSVKAAKPEIMNLLREINKFGDGAVKESTALAEELESRSYKSRKITRLDVYPGFEAASREMADMALKVRDRAEQLANEVLESLVSVRKVTLDALDDYFDVVLVEAAKQISDDDNEVEAWKEYAMLKQRMREYRKQVEEYEFNMEEVNVALRESQMASVVLVQDFNKQLSEQRARCQIVLQEREPQYEPEFRDTTDEDSAFAPPQEETNFENDAHEIPENEEARDEAHFETTTVMHARPAAYVVDEFVELEDEEPIELPFDSEVEFENPDIIETHWETRKVYQTVMT